MHVCVCVYMLQINIKGLHDFQSEICKGDPAAVSGAVQLKLASKCHYTYFPVIMLHSFILTPVKHLTYGDTWMLKIILLLPNREN